MSENIKSAIKEFPQENNDPLVLSDVICYKEAPDSGDDMPKRGIPLSRKIDFSMNLSNTKSPSDYMRLIFYYSDMQEDGKPKGNGDISVFINNEKKSLFDLSDLDFVYILKYFPQLDEKSLECSEIIERIFATKGINTQEESENFIKGGLVPLFQKGYVSAGLYLMNAMQHQAGEARQQMRDARKQVKNPPKIPLENTNLRNIFQSATMPSELARSTFMMKEIYQRDKMIRFEETAKDYEKKCTKMLKLKPKGKDKEQLTLLKDSIHRGNSTELGKEDLVKLYFLSGDPLSYTGKVIGAVTQGVMASVWVGILKAIIPPTFAFDYSKSLFLCGSIAYFFTDRVIRQRRANSQTVALMNRIQGENQ